MKKYSAALLIIFTLLLTAQLLRHLSERIFFTKESVLDKYDKKKGELSLDRSLSLRELSMIYADAEKRIRVIESGRSGKRLAQYDKGEDPYEKRAMIKELIMTREADNRALRDILFYWFAGFILVACGGLAFLKFEQWTGAAFVTAGLASMTWVLGPLFFMPFAPASEFILNIKIICTFITLAAFVAGWYYTRGYHQK